jgi:hypothetical protein
VYLLLSCGGNCDEIGNVYRLVGEAREGLRNKNFEDGSASSIEADKDFINFLLIRYDSS